MRTLTLTDHEATELKVALMAYIESENVDIDSKLFNFRQRYKAAVQAKEDDSFDFDGEFDEIATQQESTRVLQQILKTLQQ